MDPHLCQILQSAFDSHQVSPGEAPEEWGKQAWRTKDSTYERKHSAKIV